MPQQALLQQASAVRFVPYYGDRMNLVCDENHLVFRWAEEDCIMLFSVARRGNAANIHFDCDKAGIKRVKEAIGEFCEFLFWLFEWCTMVMGIIEKPSVIRAVEKIGFIHVTDIDNLKVYVRSKDGQVS